MKDGSAWLDYTMLTDVEVKSVSLFERLVHQACSVPPTSFDSHALREARDAVLRQMMEARLTAALVPGLRREIGALRAALSASPLVEP